MDERAQIYSEIYGGSNWAGRAVNTSPNFASWSAGRSDTARAVDDFIMNPFNWMAAGLGRKVVIGLGSKFARPTQIAGVVKRPFHSTLAWKSQWNQPMGKILNKTLAGRKKWNQITLGYSLLHPLENLNYIRKKDWKRLAVNTYLPIFGVPIYNTFLPVSGQQEGSSPTGPPRPIRNTPKERETNGSASSSRRSTDLLGVSSGKTPSRRRRTASNPAANGSRLRGRKFCRRHKKYDFCHRKRYGNTR